MELIMERYGSEKKSRGRESKEKDAGGNENTMTSQGGIDQYANTFNPGWRFFFAFASICVMALMVALDATSISVAIPKITAKLKGSAVEGFWTGTSFLLADTVLQPVFGSFSDIFGRKPMLYIALVLFIIGAIVAALAQDMTTLLVGRVVQGAGGAGIYVLSEILVTDLVPLRFRGNYYSLIAAMWAIGSVSGPIVGGAFSENVTWRWIFWFNLPFIGVATPMILVFLRLHFKRSSLGQKLRRVDWVGTVLFIAAATGFLVPITWAGTNYPWTSWHTLVPLSICTAGLVVFVLWEDFIAEDPLIRMRVFKNRTAAVTYFSDTIHGLVMWCGLYFLPLYYQAVKAQSPIMSGVDLLPTTLTVAPCAVIVGALIGKCGYYRWAIWIGWALTTLGFGLCITLDVDTSTASWIFKTLVTGIGGGMLFPSLTFAIMAATPNRDQAYGVSLFTFFRAAGQTIGVAVGTSIFENRVKSEILKYASIAAHAQTWSADATRLVEIIKVMPDGLDKADLIRSYADALHPLWAVMSGLSGLALILSFWTEHFSLDRALETDQGFRHRERPSNGVLENGQHESKKGEEGPTSPSDWQDTSGARSVYAYGTSTPKD